MKVMVVFGTRPEAIKMCPVVQELKTRRGIQTVVCLTGQHKEMLAQALSAFRVEPDHSLSVMRTGQSLSTLTAAILSGIDSLLRAENPDLVLVHGDTTTAFVTALACFYQGVPIGHVEAGLRTYNTSEPFPEEFNRHAIGVVAKYSFAPTETSKANLLREGKDPNSIFVTGNTVIDALRSTVRHDYRHAHLDWAQDARLLLVTAHRRESLGVSMEEMFRAIRRITEVHCDVKVIYPVHLNPAVQSIASGVLGETQRVRLIAPLDVVDFHNFLSHSYFVLTDSGGVQEEASALGKPVLVMRNATERPEGIMAGSLKLVGTREGSIFRAAERLLLDPDEYRAMSVPTDVYGDGFASKRIADVLEEASRDSASHNTG